MFYEHSQTDRILLPIRTQGHSDNHIHLVDVLSIFHVYKILKNVLNLFYTTLACSAVLAVAVQFHYICKTHPFLIIRSDVA